VRSFDREYDALAANDAVGDNAVVEAVGDFGPCDDERLRPIQKSLVRVGFRLGDERCHGLGESLDR